MSSAGGCPVTAIIARFDYIQYSRVAIRSTQHCADLKDFWTKCVRGYGPTPALRTLVKILCCTARYMCVAARRTPFECSVWLPYSWSRFIWRNLPQDSSPCPGIIFTLERDRRSDHIWLLPFRNITTAFPVAKDNLANVVQSSNMLTTCLNFSSMETLELVSMPNTRAAAYAIVCTPSG